MHAREAPCAPAPAPVHPLTSPHVGSTLPPRPPSARAKKARARTERKAAFGGLEHAALIRLCRHYRLDHRGSVSVLVGRLVACEGADPGSDAASASPTKISPAKIKGVPGPVPSPDLSTRARRVCEVDKHHPRRDRGLSQVAASMRSAHGARNPPSNAKHTPTILELGCESIFSGCAIKLMGVSDPPIYPGSFVFF